MKQQRYASKQTIRAGIARSKNFIEYLDKQINRDDFAEYCARTAREHNETSATKITAASVRQAIVGQFEEEQRTLKKLQGAVWHAK